MTKTAKTIAVVSPYGLGNGQTGTARRTAFIINAASGNVLMATVNVDAFGEVPWSFDLSEYCSFYGIEDRGDIAYIDAADIAQTLHDGTRVEASAAYRTLRLVQRCTSTRECLQQLADATSGLLRTIRKNTEEVRTANGAWAAANALLETLPARSKTPKGNQAKRRKA
jgi:hypothetical protein